MGCKRWRLNSPIKWVPTFKDFRRTCGRKLLINNLRIIIHDAFGTYVMLFIIHHCYYTASAIQFSVFWIVLCG
ncbi:hypothetical protein LOK49_LG04G01725 [Camellia lanceoleosa]|uniref:Uncharacterized protein n=1 Tax=Camellia lanceoleosa TaxID=1840588 RepID=A0ACC0I2I8_9ERIC|nr:hypothetical protein LOK49_LG04G01725 [Camellia lanceoleosa]